MNKAQHENDPVLTHASRSSTIRSRAQSLLNLAKQDKLTHFALDPEKMTATASFVTEVIQDQSLIWIFLITAAGDILKPEALIE